MMFYYGKIQNVLSAYSPHTSNWTSYHFDVYDKYKFIRLMSQSVVCNKLIRQYKPGFRMVMLQL